MREEPLRRLGLQLGLEGGHRSRDWLHWHCPFSEHTHFKGTDKDASFGIKINERGPSWYYCFSCKQSGSLSQLPVNLHKYFGGDAPETAMAQIIAAEAEQGFGMFEVDAGIEQHPDPLGYEYEGLYPDAWSYPGARDYLEWRGVTKEACEALEIKYDPDEARVVFPARDLQGNLYGYHGRTILEPEDWPKPERGMYAKSRDYLGLPKKWLLLNIQNWSPGKRIVLCEGAFDVARIQSIMTEEQNIVPVGMFGSNLLKPKAEILTELGAPVYLLFDNDEAGDIGVDGALERLGDEIPIFIPEWPEDAQDPGELEPEELEDMICKTKLHQFSRVK